MFHTFNFNTPNIIFGLDTIYQTGKEAKKLGATKVLFLTGNNVKKNGYVEKVEQLLKEEGIEFITQYESRRTPEPTTDLAENVAKFAKQEKVDLIIGMGGGSILDVAKMAAALMTNPLQVRDYFGKGKVPNKSIPSIMIPTTSGTGSEVTKHAIFLDEENNVKKAVASANIMPSVAIIDPMTTVTCPQKVTADTGFDAFLHAAEPFVSNMSNPLTDSIALESISIITKWLGPAFADGNDIEARYQMALGSLLAGLVLNNSGTSLIHALAYPIGGEFHVPHGPSLTCLVNSSFNYIKVAKQERFARIAKAMGEITDGLSEREAAEAGLNAINHLMKSVNLPTSLSDLNITDKSKADGWAEEAYQERRLLSRSARVLSVEDIKKIYLNAF
ncbi:MAG: iron-containing alcohol dehydrogenase [Tissierellales bacterium]|nr:iron-containing alcohol dehydrogenase [Tissierellales bacterium]MBN2827456.1 iron-containing alcohol dehydrogenase [Tissierellales bacterium]